MTGIAQRCILKSSSGMKRLFLAKHLGSTPISTHAGLVNVCMVVPAMELSMASETSLPLKMLALTSSFYEYSFGFVLLAVVLVP